MNKLKPFFWILLIVVTVTSVHGQTLSASFSLNKNVSCRNELIAANNTSSNYSDLSWDFCTNDFSKPPKVNNLLNLSLNSLTGFDTVFDNESWYSIAIDRNTHSLYTLDFKNSLSNIPIVHNLGNPNGSMNAPEGLKVHKNIDGNWIGFIGHLGVDYGITRINFGADLRSFDATENIGALVKGSRTRGLDLVEDGENYYLLVSGYNNNKIAVASLGNSLQNNIPDSDKHEFGAYAELNLPTGITAIKPNDDWLVYVVSQGNGNLTRFNFGTSLTNTPLVEANYALGLSGGKKIKIMKDGAKFYALIGSDTDPMTIWYMDDLNPAFTPQKIDQPDLPVAFAFDVVDVTSTKYLQTVSLGQLKNYLFAKDCGSSLNYSKEESPTISYSQPGTYPITLTATDQNGNSSSTTKEVTVISSIAPTIDFTAVNNCVTSPIQFTATSDQNITSWRWDFGDGQTATGQAITHLYSAPGTYSVRLSVDAENGCGNFIDKEVIIYPEPTPSFNELTGTVCTNKTYFFQNTTPGEFNGNISYEWFVNGTLVSSEVDLTYQFQASGAKEVKLVASIPGCRVEAVQNIAEVHEGPLPDFSVPDDCIGTIFQFTNNSTGDITSTHWDFGNGFTSSRENPSFQYTEPGTYNVTLTLTNAAGCETAVTHAVNVFQRPVIQFSNDLACEKIATKFVDQSQVGDGNIDSWKWNFGDPDSGENTSNEQHASHHFSTSGVFEVTLTATSTNGCSKSLQQVVEVLASPVADFTYDKFCVDEVVQFKDLSQPVAGEAITSWAWDLNGTFSAEVNPQITFQNPGEHHIGLTVSSQNRCTSTSYKTIVIESVPDVSFGVEDACDNTEVHLFDTTIGNVSARSWTVNGVKVGTDSSIYHKFSGAGDYKVGLQVTTENGCNYGVTRQVHVNQAPTADFQPSMFYGAPPLEIDFSNNSTGAETYTWTFEEGASTNEKDPKYTFTKKDAYDVKLVVTDINNCRDSTSRKINILDPVLDLALEQLFITPTASGNKLLLSLSNNGSIIIDSVQVQLQFGDEVITAEVLRKTILPGEQVNQMLSTSFTKKDLRYLCVTANAIINDLAEHFQADNTKCLGFEDNIMIQSPYPNPGAELLNLRIISENTTAATVRLYDVRGIVVKSYQFSALDAGINDLSIEVDDVQKGVYILKASCGSKEKIFRVVIN